MNRRAYVYRIAAILLLVAVPQVQGALTLTTNTTSVSISFATTDYDSSTGAAQVVKTTAQTVSVLSDKNAWTLSVRTLTSSFSFTASSGDTNPNKPASDLAIRAPAVSANWVALTTSNQVVATGSKSNSTQTRNLDYRLNSSLSTDPPGTYSISVVYTLTTP